MNIATVFTVCFVPMVHKNYEHTTYTVTVWHIKHDINKYIYI